jgi:hypothetical protein
MFTSEPSVARRIERMIGDTPIVDPEAHPRGDQPAAPDLAGPLDDRGARAELRAGGMPAADLGTASRVDERVRRSLASPRRMRNAAAARCLSRIFRELYDFDAHHVTATDDRDLIDEIARTGQQPTRAPHRLRDRRKIRTIPAGLGNRSVDPARKPEDVRFLLDAPDRFCPGTDTPRGLDGLGSRG